MRMALPASVACLFMALLVVSPAMGGSTSAAIEEELCGQTGLQAARGYDPDAALEASYATTARELAAFQEEDMRLAPGTSQIRQFADDKAAALCYYAGHPETVTQPPPQPGQAAPPDYTRFALMVVEAEEVIFYAAGQASNLPFTVGPDGPADPIGSAE